MENGPHGRHQDGTEPTFLRLTVKTVVTDLISRPIVGRPVCHNKFDLIPFGEMAEVFPKVSLNFT